MNAIELTGITKRFDGVVANDNVTFAARAGEVHALLGENGAGKSTLMSILAGLYRPDAGSVAIKGRAVQLRSPRDAIEQGIGMVYQHFMLVDSFSVAENVTLGQRGRGLRLGTAAVERELVRLSQRYGLRVDPRAYVWQLSVGEQQRVEILRVLYHGAEVLIFDEPTAVLTPQESAELLATLRRMATEGYCIIFISHKLDEVLTVADRITVLRRGRVMASLAARETDRRTLARLMIGREVLFRVERAPSNPGAVVLELRGLCARSDRGTPALAGVDLSVRASEIVGVAGVAGNGQRELAEVITGLRPVTSGQLRIQGQELTSRSPAVIMAAGVAHVPEDRLGTGLIPGLDLADNLILKAYRHPPLARGLFLDPQAVADFADQLIVAYAVVAPGRHAKTRLLSGGNLQKLLLARELSSSPQLLVAVHPTRGVDVGATEAIHRLLLEQRDRGAAVLLISEDLDELLALSDRIAVLYEGRVMGELPADGADVEQIGLMMAGTQLAGDAALATDQR